MVKPNSQFQQNPQEKNTEKKILKAAREEFIQTGLKGARMQSIANRAEVNKALLHYYFRSKDKLYEAALSEVLISFWSALDKEFSKDNYAPDLESTIRLFVQTHVRTMIANPDFPRLILRELADGGEMIKLIAAEIISRFGAIPLKLMDRIKNEQREGNAG